MDSSMATAPGPVFYEDEEYLIRPSRDTDEFRHVWWGFMQLLGWNRGYDDLDTYMNPSRGCGMILLVEKATRKPVGHVAAVINDNSTAWVSMFIVDGKHRGKGLGRALFHAAERDLDDKAIRARGLDGVEEQRSTYERRSFVPSALGRIQIMTRPLVAKAPIPPAPIPSGTQLIDVRKVPRALLVQHELKCTGFERAKLWSDEHLFHRRDVEGVALVSRAEPNHTGDLMAWAVNRRCSGGVRIGPVYADGRENAAAVLSAAMNLATAQTIQMLPLPNEAMNTWSQNEIAEKATLVTEMWGGNTDAITLFDAFGWQPAGVEYHRMWVNNQAPKEQSQDGLAQVGVYAIFDAAVG